MAEEHPHLVLTGVCYDKEELEDMAFFTDGDPDMERMLGGPQEAVLPDVGDLKIYSALDYEGAMAARGGHSNYGYSGYFQASIFDGKGWRLFELRSVIADSSFARQQDKPEVETKVRAAVAAAAGRACSWSIPEGKKRGKYACTVA